MYGELFHLLYLSRQDGSKAVRHSVHQWRGGVQKQDGRWG